MEFDLGMMFLYFTAASFWGVIIYANGKSLYRRYRRRKEKSFETFINDLKQMAEAAKEKAHLEAKALRGKREESTFHWRHQGKMHEVKIVIDPDLDNGIPNLEEYQKMASTGQAGKLGDFLDGVASEDAKKKMAHQTEFVFSKQSADALRQQGMTPDELVAKMLKASGRMD
jgi:hypothetical protein